MLPVAVDLHFANNDVQAQWPWLAFMCLRVPSGTLMWRRVAISGAILCGPVHPAFGQPSQMALEPRFLQSEVVQCRLITNGG